MSSRRGFERIGSADLRRAGVHAREARRLQLDRAWALAAGDAIGRRARPADIRRGVLEVEIADPAWARELAPLLPTIAGRIAVEYPELGIRKLRTVAGGVKTDLPIVIAEAERAAAPAVPAPPAGGRAAAVVEGETISSGDLLDIAARYLERARETGRIR